MPAKLQGRRQELIGQYIGRVSREAVSYDLRRLLGAEKIDLLRRRAARIKAVDRHFVLGRKPAKDPVCIVSAGRLVPVTLPGTDHDQVFVRPRHGLPHSAFG